MNIVILVLLTVEGCVLCSVACVLMYRLLQQVGAQA